MKSIFNNYVFLLCSLTLSCKKPMYDIEDIKIKNETISGENMTKKKIKILALGDSYTIGQGVVDSLRFPNQVAQMLIDSNYSIEKTKIIAQTGWRTDNLIDAIRLAADTTFYDIVTLLIGVNNQYQSRNIETYKVEFQQLINTSLVFTKNKSKNVIVISIPDYGFSPYGTSNRNKISSEINQYNDVNAEISVKNEVNYVYITDISRSNLPNLVASDNLHPSGFQYGLWSKRIGEKIIEILK